MNIVEEIAKSIRTHIEGVDFKNLITESISADKGDFCLPCFSLAKVLHDNPQNIATNIMQTVECGNIVEKCEVVAGYLNFFLNKNYVANAVIEEILTKKSSGLKVGKGKTICIDYSSVNLAKYMHIGHLKNTIIGESIARICEYLGYKVVRINYIGDYGTPFGKIIVGLETWGSEEDVNKRGIDALQEYYVKFNKEAETDASLDERARAVFKKIEEKDKHYFAVYQHIIEIAKQEAKRLLDLLGVKFDSWKGESSYSEELNNVVELLTKKGLTKISEGATIVDLGEEMPPCLIRRSDGASLYATRDIAAAIDRFKTYKFNKMFYVTGHEQMLHFKQFFKVLDLAGYDFAKDLEHIHYGLFSLPEGKISSRKGKQATLNDLILDAQHKAEEVIANRTFTIEKPEDVAWKVARGVLNFCALKVEVGKDCVFDIDKAFAFDGETAPYMQYSYTRIESILRKAEKLNLKCKADYKAINTEEGFALTKLINELDNVVLSTFEKREPSMLVKYAMDICKTLNKFYTTTKVLEGTNEEITTKLNLLKATKNVLQVLFNLICIDTLKEM